jgi:hypothetical protein
VKYLHSLVQDVRVVCDVPAQDVLNTLSLEMTLVNGVEKAVEPASTIPLKLYQI